MTTIYDDLQGVASELLKEFRQGDIYLVQQARGTGPAYNPGTPTETEILLDGVAKGVSKKFVDGTFIVMTDLEVTVAVLDGVTVSEDDFIRIDGDDYKIVADKSVPASSTRCAWKFIVRKGG